jgi:hypothetical protein
MIIFKQSFLFSILALYNNLAIADHNININLLPSIGVLSNDIIYRNNIKIRYKTQTRDYKNNILGLQFSVNNNNNVIGNYFYTKSLANAFLFITGNLGTVQLGSNFGGHYLTQADDFKNQEFSQGLEYLETLVNYDKLDIHNLNLSYSPGLYSNQYHLQNRFSNGSMIANKITYISNIDKDIVLGISYTPDNNSFIALDSNSRFSSSDINNIRNISQTSVLYKNQFNDIDFKASIGFETGLKIVNSSTENNFNSWDLATQISYMGFGIGGSYGGNSNNGHYWNYGISYSVLGLRISFSHFKSFNLKNNLDKNYIIISYHLNPRIHLFTEIIHATIKDDINKKNLSGLATGLKFSF